nr:MAG TPA: tail protein [Caudoviricetes sp.]
MAERNVVLRAVRSDGQVFEYNGDDWGLTSLEGVDFPKFEISKADRGYGNGSIITGKRKEARDIDIVARERNAGNNTLDRPLALGFHNSNFTFDLYITYMGVTRIAKGCELQGAKCPSGNVFDALTLTVSYLHPESDLLGEASESTNFTAVDPMWHWSRVYTQGGSLIYGVINHATSKVLNYLGSEDTFIHVRLEASGLVEGVNIGVGSINVHIDCTLGSGDVLELDSEAKTVKVNGADLAPASYNGELVPKLILTYGDNVVTVKADDEGNTAFDADVTYVGRYGGI